MAVHHHPVSHRGQDVLSHFIPHVVVQSRLLATWFFLLVYMHVDLSLVVSYRSHQNASPFFFLQIYMGTAATESLRDLVDPSSRGPIKIRETKQGDVWLEGLQIRDVCSSDDALVLFQAAAKARDTRSTSMNHSSSRSHALFILVRIGA